MWVTIFSSKNVSVFIRILGITYVFLVEIQSVPKLSFVTINSLLTHLSISSPHPIPIKSFQKLIVFNSIFGIRFSRTRLMSLLKIKFWSTLSLFILPNFHSFNAFRKHDILRRGMGVMLTQKQKLVYYFAGLLNIYIFLDICPIRMFMFVLAFQEFSIFFFTRFYKQFTMCVWRSTLLRVAPLFCRYEL